MDKSMNGDLSDPDNLDKIAQKLKDARFKPNLYTSDIGFDFSDDFNNEERQHRLANIAQVLCGLMVLQPGGVMITKQILCHEASSQFLISQCLGAVFEHVLFLKPETSRSFNSEFYVCAMNYKPNTTVITTVQQLWVNLRSSEELPKVARPTLEHCKEVNRPRLPLIPKVSLQEAVKLLTLEQCDQIHTVVFNHRHRRKPSTAAAVDDKARKWIEWYRRYLF